MPFDPTIAAIRFGVGLSPVVAAPASLDAMLAQLAGPDVAAAAVPIALYGQAYPSLADFRDASRAINDARGTDGEQAARDLRDALRAAGREAVGANLAAEMARCVMTPDGLRERLVRFWADHFTVRAVNGTSRHLVSSYIEEAIRPHVAGRFADMLKAVVTSPMMIVFLDQHQSMGPNSQTAQRRDRGLNENLARELLELHTLGVGGAYSQDDVRQLAELLTGITFNAQRGFFFREVQAEPGAETVLGVEYGGEDARLEDVFAALDDLAVHPDTARHLARKMAVYFVAAEPDAALVDTMAAAYFTTGGDLMAMTEAMLRHHAAWGADYLKVKQPVDFVSSALRALNVPVELLTGANLSTVRSVLQRPLGVMGQTYQAPVGPDGWPEDAESWITPQGMAGRITWAMERPEQLLDRLPDPREFVYHALGPTPPEAVVFAAGAAETLSDGIGVILASAAFQRR
ncbi:MAG: DUF1800 domain-containing protein [Octadecabacter sp.]|nr:DUF1800 domain-containing protein [Octadecabacter sp.]